MNFAPWGQRLEIRKLAYASDVKTQTENASSPKLRGKQWGAMTTRGSKIVFKVHSSLKLCFAQFSLDTIWGYFQLIFNLNSAESIPKLCLGEGGGVETL